MRRHQNDDDVSVADNDEHNDASVAVNVNVNVNVVVVVNVVVYCNQEFMFSARSLSSVEVGSAFSVCPQSTQSTQSTVLNVLFSARLISGFSMSAQGFAWLNAI